MHLTKKNLIISLIFFIILFIPLTITQVATLSIIIANTTYRTESKTQSKIHGQGGYFWHYHTISSAITIGKNGVNYNSNPHSFFGLPN